MTRRDLVRNLVIPAILAAMGILIYVTIFVEDTSSANANVCNHTGAVTGTAPSGREVSLCEIRYETQPSDDVWAVVRVVDPDLSTAAPTEDHADHDWICTTWGVPALDHTPRPARVVVQVMAAPFVRGEPSQGITQSIEAYSVRDNPCVWELL